MLLMLCAFIFICCLVFSYCTVDVFLYTVGLYYLYFLISISGVSISPLTRCKNNLAAPSCYWKLLYMLQMWHIRMD